MSKTLEEALKMLKSADDPLYRPETTEKKTKIAVAMILVAIAEELEIANHIKLLENGWSEDDL